MTYDNQPSRAAARGPRRRRGIGGAARVGLLLFAGLVALGAVGAGVAVAGFASLSAGLPEPSKLEQIELPEQSVVWDRTHKVELARFGQFNRDVVTFDQIPPVLVDATTAIEDATFWDNAGFDPVGIVAAAFDAIRGKPRGASTITQQLVRQRLLTDNGAAQTEVSASRKIKEIIQSIRVTQAFPGAVGKQRIMAAYLNQNYYGNDSYGVAAAARGYFGKELKDLTLAQAAIIAAIPQAPSTYDLVQNANEECIDPSADPQTCKTQLVVPDDTRIVQRRNLVLDQMAKGRTPLTGTQFTAADFAAAKTEKVILAPQKDTQWKANHFVWQVRRELSDQLCGADAGTCPILERGGLDITSTLDWRLQQAGEKWVQAAAIVPHAKNPAAAAKALGLSYDTWMKNLRSRDLQNSALIAQDYQTGEIVAYVGSANVYATKATKKFQPRFDVLADGWRQPGSAFKPIVYGTGIGGRYLTAASMFMDVTTDFGGGYVPTDADNLERGPVRVRDALRFSLNIPAVKAMAVIGKDAVQAQAEKMGVNFLGGKVNAGLAFALGVAEVHPKDLVRAYGALADGGQLAAQTTILEVKDGSGKPIISADARPKPEQVIDPGAAGIITDILAGNTDPNQNPFWGKFELLDKGKHRPATLKTGTNNDAKDLNAYGYVGVPSTKDRANGEYALAVGVWNGNSDNSLVSTANAPLFSIDVATYVWQGFLKDATRGWSINGFTKTDGLQTADVDPWTGLAAQPGARSVKELFLPGTTPAANVPQDARCGNGVLQTAGFEKDHKSWLQADDGWLARARRGAGVSGGPQGTRTTYFYNGVFNPYGRSWGPLLGSSGDCASPTPSASASFDPCASPLGSVDPSAPVPSVVCPSASESPSVSPSESPPVATPTPAVSTAPTPPPTAPPTPKPTPPPTPAPTPPPTPAPTPPPTPSASPS